MMLSAILIKEGRPQTEAQRRHQINLPLFPVLLNPCELHCLMFSSQNKSTQVGFQTTDSLRLGNSTACNIMQPQSTMHHSPYISATLVQPLWVLNWQWKSRKYVPRWRQST
ncbi:Chitin deacetylase 1 [Fusarium oxysporum f. sp. albedinis]|nr:Chitin deacetylase 1 [Fusarium oxysporum f. sp. albedinis]